MNVNESGVIRRVQSYEDILHEKQGKSEICLTWQKDCINKRCINSIHNRSVDVLESEMPTRTLDKSASV